MSKFNIQVAVRVRPFLDEYDDKEDQELVIRDFSVDLKTNMTQLRIKGSEEVFEVDQVFWSHDGYKELENGYFQASNDKYVDQAKLFQKQGTLLVGYALEGFNTCLVAYGQTCSGKSYSMFGKDANTGLVTQSVQELFQKIDSQKKTEDDFFVKVQMLEIYHSRVQDLLMEVNQRTVQGLKVKSLPKMGVQDDGFTKAAVQSAEDLLNIINLGIRNKAVGCTQFNKQSSRSHTIVMIEIMQKTGKADGSYQKSVITFVDLPGREKLDILQNQKDSLADGWSINKGLKGLENVVDAVIQTQLKSSNVDVNYEQANLTTILKEALGGNCKTYFLCTIQPGVKHAEHTFKTLQFAKKLRMIQNTPQTSEDIFVEPEQIKSEKDFYTKVGQKLSQKYIEAIQKEQIIKSQGGSYLINLNKDPFLDRKAFYSIEEAAPLTGGSRSLGSKHTLQFNLTCISQDHVEFKNQGNGTVTIKPLYPQKSDQLIQKIYVNGRAIQSEQVLKSGDRIWFGSSIFLQFNSPKDKKSMKKEWTYWMANKEAVQAVNMTEMKNVLSQIGDDLKKSNKLNNQSQINSSGQSKQLLDLESQGSLDDVEQFITNQMDAIENIKQQQMTKELSKILGQSAENDYNNVQSKLDDLIPLVLEANMAAKEFGRNIYFKTKLAKKFNQFLKKDKVYPIIIVDNKEENYRYEWTEQNFKHRLQKIRELQEIGQTNQKQVEQSDDPFWDPPQLFVIGEAQVSLQPLIYGDSQIQKLEIQSQADSNISFEGVSYLNVKIQPCTQNGSTKPELIPDKFAVEDYRQLIGLEDMYFKITVHSANDLPSSHCQESCVQYNLDYEVPKCEYWTHRIHKLDQDPIWSTSNVHHIPVVTEKIANSLKNGKLTFTVYALQSTTQLKGPDALQGPVEQPQIKQSNMSKSLNNSNIDEDEKESGGMQVWNSLSTESLVTTTTVALIGSYLVYKFWGNTQ